MNKRTATIAGAVALALIGGGTAFAATSSEPVTVATETPTPTVEATVEPTPTVEPTVQPTPTEEPVEPTQEAEPPAEPTQEAEPPAPATPAYSGVELEMVLWAGEHIRGYGYEITDAELLAAGYNTCARITGGEDAWGMIVFPELTQSINAGFINIAVQTLCTDAYAEHNTN